MTPGTVACAAQAAAGPLPPVFARAGQRLAEALDASRTNARQVAFGPGSDIAGGGAEAPATSLPAGGGAS